MAVFAGSQTAIFIRAVAEESRRGLKPPGKVGRDRFSNGASNQISLMKWVYGIQPDEPEATASMPMLLKIALREKNG